MMCTLNKRFNCFPLNENMKMVIFSSLFKNNCMVPINSIIIETSSSTFFSVYLTTMLNQMNPVPKFSKCQNRSNKLKEFQWKFKIPQKNSGPVHLKISYLT